MCGLLGYISFDSRPKSSLLDQSLDLMAHRGPDSRGFWSSECSKVHFAHVRLSIVELSDLGSQPMYINGFSITFNGEVYNYVELRNELIQEGVSFTGNSDTEVILRGYIHQGGRFISKLNGVFSFAIYDPNEGEVVVYRDRVGEKPLFYTATDDGIYFSSELKPLLNLAALDRSLNPSALHSYLVNGYPLDNESMVKGVYTLEPGFFMKISLKGRGYDLKRYWALPSRLSELPDFEETKSELSYLLEDSLKLQLRCDVPCSILLSGGVDSSLLTALASKNISNIRTFTVKFPGHSKFDESQSAKLISDYFATEHTEIEGVDISPDLLVKIAGEIDSPINDSSLLPTYLVNEEVSKVCRVAIGGDGGDELFGGYKHYDRMQRLSRLTTKLHHLIEILPVSLVQRALPLRSKYRNWLDAINFDSKTGSPPNIRAFYDRFKVEHILDSEISCNGKLWPCSQSQYDSVLQSLSEADFKTYLRDSILVKTDRCSMLNSVEARSPILDYRIVEFAFSKVRDEFKIQDGNKKHILKSIAKDVLPATFDFDRKLGFNLPLGSMIRHGEWKCLFGDIINSELDVLNMNFARKMFDEHLSGKEHTDRLFGIVLLLLWANENKVKL